MEKPRLRFAPSPTGYLHIGGVRTALFNWLWARKTGGTFILRIEDTDQERSTAESRQIIFDSLKWLGIDWDEGPGVGGPRGPYTQMERLEIYGKFARLLIEDKKAFRCYCTKEELDAQREALKKKDPKAQFVYPGTCRDRKDAPDRPFVVRFKTDTSGSTTYVDKVFGEITTPNSAQQDFVLLRSDGVPLYNFGAVVDDMTMGVTLVVRGRDHMVNTPPQIMLYKAFGLFLPEFAYLPMMLAPNGEKLSKRHGAVSVTEYRDQGYSPDAVLNYLARFGWSFGDKEVFSKKELVESFSWENCGRGDGKFDAKKFLAIDFEHLKSDVLTTDDEYARRTLPFLAKNGLTVADDAKLRAAIRTIRGRARTFVEAAEMLDFYFREPPKIDEAAATKFFVKASVPILRGFADAHRGGDAWDDKSIEARTNAWLEKAGIAIKELGQPARVAITGKTASPGLWEVMAVLGPAVSLARLDAAIVRAEASAS